MNELPKKHKRIMISNWKRSGVIYDNFDTLYQHYIDCKSCEWCGKVFETNRDRNLDHCHETGAFRLILCQKCNCHDSYIKYPEGYDKKKYYKEWYEKDKDRIKEKMKEYNIDNKDKLKEYKDKNKDKIKEKNKEYREKNRDKIRDKFNKKYTCECGSTLSIGNKSKHEKTIKHQANNL